MFCYNCGNVLKEEAEFCHKCGVKVVFKEGEKDTLSSNAVEIPKNSLTAKNTDFENPFNEKEEDLLEISSDTGKTIIGIGIVGLLGIGVGEAIRIPILSRISLILVAVCVVIYVIYIIIAGNGRERKYLWDASKKMVCFFVIFCIIILSIVFIVNKNPYFFSDFFRPGSRIRDSYLTQYSDKTTIDEAFNRYFDNENWRTYEKDGYSYVSFKGTCKYMGKTEDICIRFMITGEKFMVCGLDINGQIQSDALLKEFLTNIFEEDDSKEK